MLCYILARWCTLLILVYVSLAGWVLFGVVKAYFIFWVYSYSAYFWVVYWYFGWVLVACGVVFCCFSGNVDEVGWDVFVCGIFVCECGLVSCI